MDNKAMYTHTPESGPHIEEDRQYVEELRKRVLDPLNKDSGNLGSSPKEVLELHDNELTEFEKKEILNFERIFTIGDSFVRAQKTFDATGNMVVSDNEGRYVLYRNDHIAYRYTIHGVSGEGMFSQVAWATDRKTDKPVALKVMKDNAALLYAEIKMLMFIQERDTLGVSNCVKLLDFGTFRSRLYLVLESFNGDLHRFIRRTIPTSVDMKIVARMGQSLLSGLSFLNQNGIIHADLKPSNILLNEGNVAKLKIADFGLSFLTEHAKTTRTLQTCYYRAPEMFCGGLPTTAIDMWSFGCIMIDLTHGFRLLKGVNDTDQFILIQQHFGTPPAQFFDICANTKQYFHNNRVPKHCTAMRNKNTGRIFLSVNPDLDDCPVNRFAPGTVPIHQYFQGNKKVMLDLLQKIFKWVPSDRISPALASQHDFFKSI